MERSAFDSAGANPSGGVEEASERQQKRAEMFTTSADALREGGSSFGQAAIDMFIESQDREQQQQQQGRSQAVPPQDTQQPQAPAQAQGSAAAQPAGASTPAGGYEQQADSPQAAGDSGASPSVNPLDSRYREAVQHRNEGMVGAEDAAAIAQKGYTDSAQAEEVARGAWNDSAAATGDFTTHAEQADFTARDGSEFDAVGYGSTVLSEDRLASRTESTHGNPLDARYRAASQERAEGLPAEPEGYAASSATEFAGQAERTGAALSAYSSAEEIARAMGAEYTGSAGAVDASASTAGIGSEYTETSAGIFAETSIDGAAVADGYGTRSRMLRQSGVDGAGLDGEYSAVGTDAPSGREGGELALASEFSGSADRSAEAEGMFDAASSRSPFAAKAKGFAKSAAEGAIQGAIRDAGSGSTGGRAGAAVAGAAVAAAFKKGKGGIAGAALRAATADADENVRTAVDKVQEARAGYHGAKMVGRKVAQFRARRAGMKGVSDAAAQRKSMAIAKGIREGKTVSGMGTSARLKAATKAAGRGARAGVANGAKGALAAAASQPLMVLGALLLLVIILAAAMGGAKQDTGGTGTLTGIEAEVAQFFKDKGLGDVQVAAIMGNMYAESGMNPAAQEDGGGGYGLCQWTGGRRTKLENYAASVGKPASDLAVQLEFFWSHDIFDGDWSGKYYITKKKFDGDPEPGTIVSGSKAKFLSTKDVAEAVKEFCYGWERPGIPHITKRVDKAKEYLDALSSNLSGEDYDSANAKQKKVANLAANNLYGYKLGNCQGWVRKIYEAAGICNESSCCATSAGLKWVVSKSKTGIPVGATVYVSKSAVGTKDPVCGREAGHVGIYIGDGKVASNRGGSAPYIETLESFAKNYGKGGWMGWGWNGGCSLI